jgi:hypothetical protein
LKKILIYITTILIGASIPVYFLLIWEPLKSEEAISRNSIDINTENKIDMEKSNANEKVLSDEKALEDKEINNDNEINKKEVTLIKNGTINNNLFNGLEKTKREEINKILKNLSVVDIIQINEYFSNSEDKINLKNGILLVKKRTSNSEYEVFKNIMNEYINLEELEVEI